MIDASFLEDGTLTKVGSTTIHVIVQINAESVRGAIDAFYDLMASELPLTVNSVSCDTGIDEPRSA